ATSRASPTTSPSAGRLRSGSRRRWSSTPISSVTSSPRSNKRPSLAPSATASYPRRPTSRCWAPRTSSTASTMRCSRSTSRRVPSSAPRPAAGSPSIRAFPTCSSTKTSPCSQVAPSVCCHPEEVRVPLCLCSQLES
ncbi:unnamed protein product, partial [Musa acuminata subsp. burmannicoides]